MFGGFVWFLLHHPSWRINIHEMWINFYMRSTQSVTVVRSSKGKNKTKEGKLKEEQIKEIFKYCIKGKWSTIKYIEEISFRLRARMFSPHRNHKNDNRMIMMCFLPLSVFLFYPCSRNECSFSSASISLLWEMMS